MRRKLSILALLRTYFDRLYRWWTTPLPLGTRGENAAAKFLRQKKYHIIAMQQRDHRLGEIDLIAVDGRTVVFVEVKTRATQHSGNPSEAVDREKQERMQRVALKWLRRKELLNNAARFDVVAVTWPDPKKPPVIQHFENAFEPSGKGQMYS